MTMHIRSRRWTLPLIAMAWLIAALHGSVAAQDFTPPVVDTPSGAFLDVDWYHKYLITTVDLWDGGLDGQNGMGVYRDDFDGFFDVNLARDFTRERIGANTVIAQSRAVYMNVEAYRAAGAADGQRFLDAVTVGTDYLLDHFWDTESGGFYWEVNARGQVTDDQKQGYGNVHPLMVLAQAYSVTQNPRYLEAALAQLDVIEQHFLDPQYPGGYFPGFTRDFSEIMGVNNVDSFTHYFEALLALYDVTGGEVRERITDKIVLEGDFLTETLYVPQEGHDGQGYVAYNYDENWLPAQAPYTRETQWSGAMHASTGHNIELAYLLSRAVERGFNPEWLDTADKLVKFCLEFAIDDVHGGMLYDTTDYDGQPLEGNPDNPYYVWWAQGETARALLHFIVVRGHDEYVAPFLRIQDLINNHLTDHEYGSWVQNLDAVTLVPAGYQKGNVWAVNYHFSMLYAEVLRLAAQYPERLAALEAAY